MSDPAQVKLINTALNALGQEPVQDLTEASLQASVAAVKLMRVVEDAREAVLSRHGWGFALSYATLPPAVLPDLVNWRYPTVFLLPGDALQVWEIAGDVFSPEGGFGPRWQVGTLDYQDSARTFVLASADACAGGTLDSLQVAYVRRANWSAMGALMRDAIAYETAARAAWSITGDRAVESAKRKQAEDAVKLAISLDATQEGGQPPAAPSIPAAIRASSR